MPRATTRARGARIELTIPIRMASAVATDAGQDCYLCRNEFCDEDVCSRGLTHLQCCTQTMCCGCLAKLVKRCRCVEDCEAVIAMCPFCREVSPVTVLDVFLGHAGACKGCAAEDLKDLKAGDDDDEDEDGEDDDEADDEDDEDEDDEDNDDEEADEADDDGHAG